MYELPKKISQRHLLRVQLEGFEANQEPSSYAEIFDVILLSSGYETWEAFMLQAF